MAADVTELATTRVRVATGYTEDKRGDLVPVPVDPSSESFPASIIEKSRTIFDETTLARRTVRYFSGRITPRAGVKDGDRLHCLTSGSVYIVGEVSRGRRTLAGTSPVSLTLDLLEGPDHG